MPDCPIARYGYTAAAAAAITYRIVLVLCIYLLYLLLSLLHVYVHVLVLDYLVRAIRTYSMFVRFDRTRSVPAPRYFLKSFTI